MKFFFLDVADAGVSGGSFDWTLIIVLVVTIFIEAAILFLMKYNRIRKSLQDSFIINIASIATGFVLYKYAVSLFSSYSFRNLLILFAITVVIEFAVLYLLNRKTEIAKTLRSVILINIVSYFLLYLFMSALSG